MSASANAKGEDSPQIIDISDDEADEGDSGEAYSEEAYSGEACTRTLMDEQEQAYLLEQASDRKRKRERMQEREVQGMMAEDVNCAVKQHESREAKRARIADQYEALFRSRSKL